MAHFRERLELLTSSQSWYKGLLFIAFFSSFWVLLCRIWIIPFYDAEIGGWEYEIIYEVHKILVTGSVYTDPEFSPFHITQKTPVYQYLLAIISKADKVFFLNGPMRLFRLNRIVSLLLSLGSAVLFYFLLRKRFGVGNVIAIIGALLCFGSFGQHYYARMDSLYILLFLILLLITLSVEPSVSRKAFFLALFTSLAVFTKQSGVLYIPIVIGLLAIVEKRPAIIISRYLAFGAAIAILIWIFWGHSKFEILYKNLVVGLAVGKCWSFLIGVLLSESFGPLFLFGIGAMAILIKDKSKTGKVLVMLLSFTLLFSLYLLRNKGAGINYITEFRLAVISSMTYFSQKENAESKAWRKWAFSLFVLHLSLTNVIYMYRGQRKITSPFGYAK